MKKLLALLNLWQQLPEETRKQILDRWPWLVGMALAFALACYFTCRECCRPKKIDPVEPVEVEVEAAPEKKVCPCSPRCSCGCNEGQPCHCEWPGNPLRVKGGGSGGKGQPNPDEETNFGIDGADKISAGAPKILRRGKEISGDEAKRLLLRCSSSDASATPWTEFSAGQRKVPDDRQLVRLTVIGSKEARERVLADLKSAPELTKYQGLLAVQAYNPTDWAVADYGFVTTGSPTIYLQTPSGKVLHRQDTYTGPAPLAEALRRAAPNYDPTKDPDLTKPKSPVPLPFDPAKIPPSAWVLGGAALFLLLRQQQQQQPAKKE